MQITLRSRAGHYQLASPSNSRRTSDRTTGTSSDSNQGLRLSQPVLRQEGCGSGSSLGASRADQISGQCCSVCDSDAPR